MKKLTKSDNTSQTYLLWIVAAKAYTQMMDFFNFKLSIAKSVVISDQKEEDMEGHEAEDVDAKEMYIWYNS